MVKHAAALALVVCLALAAAPPAGAEDRRPVLLLFHSGGFFLDSGPMPIPEREAERLGFRPKFVVYPNDLPAAVRAAREAARRARRNGHEVYAYGESSGGLLAAIVARERLVRAASTYCPIADMVAFVRHFDDPETYQALINASDRDLRRYSPASRDSPRPILAMRAVNDSGWFNRRIRAWDRGDDDVTSVQVPGRHLENPHRPSVYRANVRRGTRWLARAAGSTPLHLLK